MSVRLPGMPRLYGTKLGNFAPGIEICVENMLNCDIRSRRDKRGSMPGLYPPSEPTRRVRSDSHPRKMAIGALLGRRGGRSDAGRNSKTSTSQPTGSDAALRSSTPILSPNPSAAQISGGCHFAMSIPPVCYVLNSEYLVAKQVVDAATD